MASDTDYASLSNSRLDHLLDVFTQQCGHRRASEQTFTTAWDECGKINAEIDRRRKSAAADRAPVDAAEREG